MTIGLAPQQRPATYLKTAFLSLFLTALFWIPGFPQPSQAAPGDLDPTFGTGGKATVSAAMMNEANQVAAAAQPDGKIVVVGPATGNAYDFGVMRFNADGSLDSSFGTGGIVLTDLGGVNDFPRDVAIQADGKIVVVGSIVRTSGTFNDFGVVRYNPDGSLDASFGSGGQVVHDFFGMTDDAYAVVIQADGKILVSGAAYSSQTVRDLVLVRYQADGSPDSGFGSNGVVVTDLNNSIDTGADLALQSDGKIVIVDRGINDFGMVRYNPDGSLDPTFGVGGKVTTNITGASEASNRLVIQPDGKIILAGFGYLSSTDFVLVRYNDNGSLDSDFGTGGFITTNFSGGADAPSALVLQGDGKIIAGGYAAIGSNTDFALARYNIDGSLDSSFGTGGTLTTDFFGAYDSIYDFVFPSNGKLVSAGVARQSATGPFLFALARYEVDGIGGLQQRIYDGLCQGNENAIAVGGNAGELTVCLEANVTDAAGGTVRLEIEVKPVGITFDGNGLVCSPSCGATGPDGLKIMTVSGLSYGNSYHWRSRMVDAQGTAISWLSFGNNLETDADFIALNASPVVNAFQQRIFDGLCQGNEAIVPVGGSIGQNPTLCLEANVTDTVSDTVRLELEVKPVGVAFTNIATHCSPSCTTTTTAGTKIVTVSGLSLGLSYHWQARGVDNNAAASAWVSFGGNSEAATDFSTANVAPTLTSLQQRIYDGLCQGNEATVSLAGTITQSSICLEANIGDSSGDTVRLELEVKPFPTLFNGTGLVCVPADCVSFSSQGLQIATVNGLVPSGYHWRARAVDNYGAVGSWINFNPYGFTPDFTVANTAPTLASVEQRLYDGTCDGNEVTVAEGGGILQQSICFNASLSDPNAGQTITLQVEARLVGTAFTNVATATSAAVSSGTVARVTVSGLSYGASYHWQSRAVDSAGGAGPWTEFGTAGNTDFSVINASPTAAAVQQRVDDGSCDGNEATVVEGGTILQQSLCINATLTDTNTLPSQTITLQVEVQPSVVAFTGIATATSASVTSGSVARMQVGSLSSGVSYHWRYRAVDSAGGAGPWTEFGTAGNTDFSVTNPAPTITALQQRIYDGLCQGNEAVVPVGGSITTTSICLEANVNDADASQTVQLQIEVQPVGVAFSGSANNGSTFGSQGTKVLTVGGLVFGTAYHWQARGIDSLGAAGAWVAFGGNADPNDPDFTAVNPNPTADLSITKTDSPDPVTVGSNLTYTVTVANSGPDAATGVTVTDTLPSGVAFVSAASTQGSCSGTSTVTCGIGTLANGAGATVTIVVTPTVAGTISNTAGVSGNETDPNTANNTATASTTVNAPSCIGTGSFSISGSTKTSGGAAITDVTITLTGPGGCTATTATSSIGKYSIAGLGNGTYTVTPSKTGYSFTPASQTKTISGRSIKNVNFTGTPTP